MTTDTKQPNLGLAMTSILPELNKLTVADFHAIKKPEKEPDHTVVGPAGELLLSLAVLCQKVEKALQEHAESHNAQIELGRVNKTENELARHQADVLEARAAFLKSWCLAEVLETYPQIPADVQTCIDNAGNVGYLTPASMHTRVTIQVMPVSADGSDHGLFESVLDILGGKRGKRPSTH